jgi:hypothetical protein
MEGLPTHRWPLAGDGLRGDVWGGFDPTGFEGYAEPPMNAEGDKTPMKTYFFSPFTAALLKISL